MADQLRGKFTKIGSLMDTAEHEVLAYMDFPKAHWPQIHSTNPLERLNAEIKRRTNVVGIFPNDRACTRLASVMPLEQSDEWALQRRYLQLEGLQTLRYCPGSPACRAAMSTACISACPGCGVPPCDGTRSGATG